MATEVLLHQYSNQGGEFFPAVENEASGQIELFDFDFLPGTQLQLHLLIEVTAIGGTFLRFRYYYGPGPSFPFTPTLLATFPDIVAPGVYHLTVAAPNPGGLHCLMFTSETDGGANAVNKTRLLEVLP